MTMHTSTFVQFTLGALLLGFSAGAYVNKPVHSASPATHIVNGVTLSDSQFNAQLAVQQAANDKMAADYAATLVQEKAANDAKMDTFVQALVKKAQKDHGLWIASPIKHDTSL